MWRLLQPVFAALLGAVMTVFGFLHAIQLWPAPAVWSQVAVAAPQLLTVVLALGCVALAVAGGAMLVIGIRRAHRRFAQLRRVPWDGPVDRFDDPREQWAG